MNDIKSELLKNLVNEYNYYYEIEKTQEYFIEFYSDEIMNNNNYYIDDDFILYQHIEYEKCYK